MRIAILRATTLASAVAACLPYAASAQLEEILVTATRRETNLQDTPLSIQAFTAEQLELSGITNGRDLGIMVPNVVLNPGTGGAQSQFVIRGLPGVGLYVDGVWQDGFGFQQMNFTEMERIERWRAEELERAGYEPRAAGRLAVRHDVDLHSAIELLERGCPTDLALRILL